MPDAFPSPPRIDVRGTACGAGEDVARFRSAPETAFAVVARGGRRAVDLTIATCTQLFESRTSARLDDLAERWWLGEHGEDGPKGRRARRPYASLPLADRVELREHVKRVLDARIPESLGDVAVLEAELASLLDLPARALGRAGAAIYRKAETDSRWREELASAACAVVAGGKIGLAHVGDCRVSRVRAGSVEALTQEHVRVLGASDVADIEHSVLSAARGDVFFLLTRGASCPSAELVAAARATDAATYLARRSGTSCAAVAIEIL
jgi:hypothetical protein